MSDNVIEFPKAELTDDELDTRRANAFFDMLELIQDLSGYVQDTGHASDCPTRKKGGACVCGQVELEQRILATVRAAVPRGMHVSWVESDPCARCGKTITGNKEIDGECPSLEGV